MKLYRKFYSEKEDKKKDIAGKTLVVSGGGLLASVNRDKLTGLEHRYHNTSERNIESIKNSGIKASYSTDLNNLSNTVLRDVDMSKKKGKVYLAKGRMTAKGVGIMRDKLTGGKSKTVKVNIPYEEYKKLKLVDNPEIRGMNKKDWVNDRFKKQKSALFGQFEIDAAGGDFLYKQQLKHVYDDLSKGTEVIKGDIDSRFIKGGKGYKKYGLRDMAKYAKDNKARFGVQAAKGVAGLGMISGGAYLINKSRKKKKENE